jgi:hypothetical protein
MSMWELIRGKAEINPMAAASRQMADLRDPFLLPVCDCGGPMNLASLEPHATLQDHELKTYKCDRCGTHQVFDVLRRARKIGDYSR